jgi:hypothetical protein
MTRSSIASVARRPKMPPPVERMWAVYKRPPWWTMVIAFVLSIGIHLGAVALLETGPEGGVARLWENRVLNGEGLRPDERAND